MGALSRTGRAPPVLMVFTVLPTCTAYPALSWLVANISFEHLLATELWLSFIYGSYNGAAVVALTEVMPVMCARSAFPWPTAWPPQSSAALRR